MACGSATSLPDRAPRQHQIGLCSLAIALVLAFVLVSVVPADAAVVDAPGEAVIGGTIADSLAGFPAGSTVDVMLQPASRRDGNCCGTTVLEDQLVGADGSALLAFTWPDGYQACAGAGHARFARGFATKRPT